MPFTSQALSLPLKTPFRTAHGESHERTNALVELEDEQGTYFGEGALPPYYPHDVDEVARYVGALDAADVLAPPPSALHAQLARLPEGPAPARCAVDLALHDRWARHLGHPLYEVLGLDPSDAPPSSITISLTEDLGALREQAQAHRTRPVLKLKVGSGSVEQDEQAVRIVQEETEAQIGIDANEAWTVDEAAALIPRLPELLFIEEPLQERSPAAWQELHEKLSASSTTLAPLIADESVQDEKDLLRLAPWTDGFNVKLAKAGGLAPAGRWIAVARALNRKVLLGCMIESSLAVTAAAHLAPLADFADLDGALSLTKDPFEGLHFSPEGRPVPPDRPGLGVVRET